MDNGKQQQIDKIWREICDALKTIRDLSQGESSMLAFYDASLTVALHDIIMLRRHLTRDSGRDLLPEFGNRTHWESQSTSFAKHNPVTLDDIIAHDWEHMTLDVEDEDDDG